MKIAIPVLILLLAIPAFSQGFRKKTARHRNKIPRAAVLGYGGRLNSSRPGLAVDDAVGGAPKFLA